MRNGGVDAERIFITTPRSANSVSMLIGFKRGRYKGVCGENRNVYVYE